MAELQRAWCAMGLILGLSSTAWGAPAEVTLEAVSPVGCPSAAEIRAMLEQYLPGAEVSLQQATDQLPAVRITLSHTDNETRALVWVRVPPSQIHERTLSIADCREASLASAFVAAVLLDPSRATDGSAGVQAGKAGAGPEQEQSSVEPVGREAEPTPSTPSDMADEQDPSRLNPETARSQGRKGRGQKTKGEAGDVGRGFIGSSAVFGVGPAPEVLAGPAISAGLSSGRTGAWAPHAELQVSYQWSQPSVQPAGDALFDLGLVTLRLCPSQLLLGRARFGACLSVRGGWMWARGMETFQGAQVTRPWLDLGPSLTGSVGLFGPVRLTAAIGLGFALVRDQFQFDSTVFHQAGPIAGEGSMGVAADIF